MSFSFKSILIPVDFSINTEVAIKKAVALAEVGTDIHLLYVQNPVLTILPTRSFKNAYQKLNEWKDRIEGDSKSIEVFIWIRFEEAIHKTIEAIAKKLLPDLIIIGKIYITTGFHFGILLSQIK